MNLTRFLVGRPLLTSMFFGAVVLLGIASAVQLPISSMPDIDYPFVIVQFEDPGAGATSVKHDVTDPVEDAISQLGSVKSLTGVSSVGSSMVIVELTAGTDVNTAAADIAQAVNRSARALPDGIGSPTITKINPSAVPALVVNFSGADLTAVADALDRDVVPALRLVDGVGQVTLVGDRPTVTNVVVDADRLTARGLTISQITSAVTGQNVASAAGSAATGDTDSQLRVDGRAATGSQLGEVVVGSGGGGPVKLSDVATLQDGPAKASSVSQLNGLPTIALEITPKTGSNLLTMAEAAKKTLEANKGGLPPGTTMSITSDSSEFTWSSVSATAEDLALAVLLASIVLLFLQSFRQTIIVLVAIPTSLLATTFMMRLLHFSIDIVSLLGMSLLIGVLVDDAVVVIENITRHLAMGKNRVDAAVEGRTEIAGAAVALTLVDVVVFTPIAVAPGLVGDILIEMALTVVVATLFSLLVSFTLTPMLAARWLKPHDPNRRPLAPARVLQRGLDLLDRGYVRVLRASLRHRFTVLVVGFCSLLTAVGLATSGKIGTTAIPDIDSNALSAAVTLPSGTSLERSTAVLTDLSDRFAAIPDVIEVSGSAGSSGFNTAGARSVSLTLHLVDKNRRSLSVDELKRRMSAQIDTIPGARGSVALADSADGGGGGGGLPVLLTGSQLPVLQGVSRDVMAKLRARPELTSVSSDTSETSPSWDITVDREAAGRLGVSTAQILATVSAATDSGAEVSSVQTPSGRDQKIRVSLRTGPEGLGLAELRALPVAVGASAAGASSSGAAASGAASGGAASGGAASGATATAPRPVTLGQVARVRRSSAPQVVNDSDQQPQVTVNAFAAPGVSQSTAQKAIDEVMAGVTLPAGYTWKVGGAVENQSEIFLPLILSIGLSPILIYMLLAALYESLVLPFAVLLAQPLAVVGALFALYVGRSSINLFSLIGMVLLIGLVSKNGILLIDRTEQKRREGLSAVEALAEAGRVRLRPILMTSMTLVVAMLPIALSTSSGSEYRQPLALVLIGGMSSSTVLTMLVVPTLYTLLDALRQRLPRALRGLLRGRVPGGLSRRTRGGAGGVAAGAPPRVSPALVPPPAGHPDVPSVEPDTDPAGLRILLRGGPQ